MIEAQEEWRPVYEWEGVYEVSSIGRVKRIKAASGATAGALLACPPAHRGGYPMVGLFDGPRRRMRTVHSLVAEAFIGPRPTGLQVNHIDHTRTNNRRENLEYVTPKGNIQHAKRAGRLRGGGPKGEKSPKAKLSLIQMLDARARWGAGLASQVELATEYGVTRQAIWLIVHRKNWKAA